MGPSCRWSEKCYLWKKSFSSVCVVFCIYMCVVDLCSLMYMSICLRICVRMYAECKCISYPSIINVCAHTLASLIALCSCVCLQIHRKSPYLLLWEIILGLPVPALFTRQLGAYFVWNIFILESSEKFKKMNPTASLVRCLRKSRK